MTRKRRKPRYENVTSYQDRHGKLRWRWRKTGFPSHTFKHAPDTPGFAEEYAGVKAAGPLQARGQRIVPYSVADLFSRYYRSASFRTGGLEDQHRRKGILSGFRDEFGPDMVADFGFEHIEAILLTKSEKRVNDKGRTVGGLVAARTLRKQLRRAFAYAKKLGWITSNPVEEAEPVGKAKLTGYHTWTEAEIAQYQRRHPFGTKARLAMEIMLWTGQRRGDARLFGPKHIVRGKINYQAGKTGMDLWLPVAPDLRRAIDAMPAVGVTTYLVTDYGKPFSKAGFGNWMRDRCDEAGLPGCTSHGLRKAIARRMAEAGTANAGLKAVGGWRTESQVSIYTAAAEQEMLADAAVARLIERHPGDQNG